MIFQIPSFKAFIYAEVTSQEKTILFDQKNCRHLLQGKAYALLAPYLSKGKHSADQIVDLLSHKLSAPEIYYALLRLEERGFLEEGESKLPKSIQTLCNLLDVSYKEAETRLKNTFVSLQVFGDVSSDISNSALTEMGVKIEKEGIFSIGVTDNYRDPKLREKFLHSKTPYLLIQPTGSEVWIGPLFTPGKGPCLDCFLDALNKNSFEELLIEREMKSSSPLTIKATVPSTMGALAYNLAANEVIKWILKGENPDLESKLLSCHFLKPVISSHHVIKKPDCPTCGTLSHFEQKPLVLTSQKKIFTEDGGHRIKSPEETYKEYEHLISPVTGVIDFLIPSGESEHTLMHTYEAGHRMSGLHFDHALIHKNPRSRSAGKGRSAAQGKTSCLCEALERYSGIYQGNESKKRATYDSVKEDAIHPDTLLHFSGAQYGSKDVNNKKCSSFHFVSDPFDSSKEIDWTSVWSLTENRFKQIPTAICYFNYPFPNEANKFCRGDSNGSAAGNTIEEAILQGFFELVERDQIALWWYSRLKRPEVDLKSFSDPYIDKLISSYASMNRKFWVLDITFDLKIPTFVAISCNESGGEVVFGFGSHFDPNISMLRALTEMNQALLFLKQIQANPSVDTTRQMIRDWMDKETLQDHLYLVPDACAKKRRGDYKRFDAPDIKDDVLMCQKIIENKGLEMLVLDQTRPDIGLPVVKVFVPGLRHFWNRYAPGRLYDVPFEMGLVKQKLKEEELNPIPFFL